METTRIGHGTMAASSGGSAAPHEFVCGAAVAGSTSPFCIVCALQPQPPLLASRLLSQIDLSKLNLGHVCHRGLYASSPALRYWLQLLERQQQLMALQPDEQQRLAAGAAAGALAGAMVGAIAGAVAGTAPTAADAGAWAAVRSEAGSVEGGAAGNAAGLAIRAAGGAASEPASGRLDTEPLAAAVTHALFGPAGALRGAADTAKAESLATPATVGHVLGQATAAAGNGEEEEGRTQTARAYTARLARTASAPELASGLAMGVAPTASGVVAALPPTGASPLLRLPHWSSVIAHDPWQRLMSALGRGPEYQLDALQRQRKRIKRAVLVVLAAQLQAR